MEQLSAHIGLVTSEGMHESRLEKLQRDLGEVFLTALADPATVGFLLNADGTLWQERQREPESWRPIETLVDSRAETVFRTVAACLQTTNALDKATLEVELPLERSRFAGQIPPVVRARPTKFPVATKSSPGHVRLLQIEAPASDTQTFIPALSAQDFVNKELLEECRTRGTYPLSNPRLTSPPEAALK